MKFTLDIPAGIDGDDTSFSASPRWLDGSNVRFRLNRPQVIGGWEALMTDMLSGVCRMVFPWTDNLGQLDLAFGTHATLELWQGGELFDITPTGLGPGSIDGTGGIGYGTGAYGIGGYGEPSAVSYFPRTWSLAAWGQDLMASPRAGTIYRWNATDTSMPAVAITNAPAVVTHMLVAPMDGGYQLFALGCNEEVSGVFNPLCIRHSSIRINDEWNTAANTTAREYVLTGGGRIVAGRMCGPNMLVWTTSGLFLGTFVGNLNQPWRFDRVGLNCGLIGPNAAVVVGQRAFWISPDRQFHQYSLGGEPILVSCPIREAFADNLSAAQADKIVGSSISEFEEIRFDYPDARDGVENSRYLALAVAGENAGAWYRGIMGRTAFVDAGPSLYTCGVTYGGQAYWHERGHSADGGSFAWFIRSSDQYLDENNTMLVRGVWPDVQGQIGPINMTLTTRYKPQGVETMYGPYSMGTTTERVDFKAKGRLFKIQFYGESSPTDFRLGKPVFDAKACGTR